MLVSVGISSLQKLFLSDKDFELFELAVHQTEYSGLEQRLSLKFWLLRIANHVKLHNYVRCVMKSMLWCKKKTIYEWAKHEFPTTRLGRKDSLHNEKKKKS